MSLLTDLRVLYHIVAKPVRGKDHAARLESFYSGQAEAYDDFRRRLLQGREAMYRSIPVPEGGVWVDLGGGTGANLEPIGADLHKARKVYLVDLCDSLLAVARKRSAGPRVEERRGRQRRRDDLPARRRPGRRGDLFLLADDDPRLVCRDRQRPGDVAAGRDDRRDRLLRRPQVSGRGPRPALLVHADLLARLVRLGQRLLVARSRSLFAAKLPHAAIGREAGEGALYSPDPRAVLHVSWDRKRNKERNPCQLAWQVD